MNVRAQPSQLGKPVELENLRTVVICDRYGAPLLVAQTLETGVIVVYKHTDPEFTEAIKALGIGLNTTYTGKS